MPQYRLYSWGANSHGQLGHGEIEEEELLAPREVDLSSIDLRPENVKKIVGGAGHTLILDKSGSIYSCGWNSKGQAGTVESSKTFQKLEKLRNERIIDIDCGWDSSIALTEDGKVFVWGSNSHGQLGLSTIPIGGKTNKPSELEFDKPIQRISMGLRHAALVTQDSRIFLSGTGVKGQLGRVLQGSKCSNTFTEVPGMKDAKDVSCGQHHTLIVTLENEVFACGDNKHGQLGIDPKICKSVLVPLKVENCKYTPDIQKIHCGWTHSIVYNVDGKIWCWGRNSYGQLGRGKSTVETTFWEAEIPSMISSKIQQFSVGSEHNVALTDDGTVISWGWNEHGNCGNGNAEDIFIPTKVALPNGFGVLVGAGAGHSFAIIRTDLETDFLTQ